MFSPSSISLITIFFCRLAKCHDQHRSEIFGEVQFFFDGIGIVVSNHATAKSTFSCRQKHGLCHNSDIFLVSRDGSSKVQILADDDKSCRAHARMRKLHLRKRPRPVCQFLDSVYFFILPCQIITKWLAFTLDGAKRAQSTKSSNSSLLKR